MSSYAAVIARPFNSVTNLSILWKPQTINHGVQLGGPVTESSAPVPWPRTAPALVAGTRFCWETSWSTGFTGSKGEVTHFTQLLPSHGGKQKRTGLRHAPRQSDRRRWESFCQQPQQQEDCLCFSYSSSPFGLCHHCLPHLNPGLVDELSAKKSFDGSGKLDCWHTDSFSDFLFGVFPFISVYTMWAVRAKWLLTDKCRRWIHIHSGKSKIHAYAFQTSICRQ